MARFSQWQRATDGIVAHAGSCASSLGSAGSTDDPQRLQGLANHREGFALADVALDKSSAVKKTARQAFGETSELLEFDVLQDTALLRRAQVVSPVEDRRLNLTETAG